MTLINPLQVDIDDEPDDYMEPIAHGEAGPQKFPKQTIKTHVFMTTMLIFFIRTLKIKSPDHQILNFFIFL